jgi:hypothetical protein
MSLAARYIVFDCRDPARLTRFWNEVLDLPVGSVSAARQIKVPITGDLAMIFSDDFRVGESVAGRLHVQFTSTRGTLSDEVDRLIDAGATLLDDHRHPDMDYPDIDYVGWVVMADPEGNEFLVESNEAEVAALNARIDASNAAHREGKAAHAAKIAALVAEVLGEEEPRLRPSPWWQRFRRTKNTAAK